MSIPYFGTGWVKNILIKNMISITFLQTLLCGGSELLHLLVHLKSGRVSDQDPGVLVGSGSGCFGRIRIRIEKGLDLDPVWLSKSKIHKESG